MRKSMFLVMSAMILLASCSKENDTVMDNGGKTPEVNPDAMKIELGTKSMSASVTPETRGTLDNWDNTSIGIFSLAKGITDEWKLTDNNTCIMNNAKGVVTTGANGTDVQITLDKTYYYPMSSIYNYSFYGYYPYIDNTVIDGITTDGTIVKAMYATFDGTQDIIYGTAVASKIDIYDGYNAKYFRKAAGAQKPVITFKHLLTRLKFNIIASGENQAEIEIAKKLKITAIEIVKVPTNISLILADRIGTSNGNLEFTTPVDETSSYKLKDSAGGDAAETAPGDAPGGAPMGDYMMLPANAVQAQGAYIARISMRSTVDNAPTIPVSTLNIALNNGAKFEAGKSYNVKLTVNGLSEITISANLVGWINGDEDADIEIN